MSSAGRSGTTCRRATRRRRELPHRHGPRQGQGLGRRERARARASRPPTSCKTGPDLEMALLRQRRAAHPARARRQMHHAFGDLIAYASLGLHAARRARCSARGRRRAAPCIESGAVPAPRPDRDGDRGHRHAAQPRRRALGPAGISNGGRARMPYVVCGQSGPRRPGEEAVGRAPRSDATVEPSRAEARNVLLYQPHARPGEPARLLLLRAVRRRGRLPGARRVGALQGDRLRRCDPAPRVSAPPRVLPDDAEADFLR